MENKIFSIKISGSGKKEEILKALEALQETLRDGSYNGGFVIAEETGKFTAEDEILITEIHEGD
jgi:hypothetical protein